MQTLKHPQLIAALGKVIGSKPYSPIKLMYRQDHTKLLEEMKGRRRPQAGSLFYRGLIDIARFAYVTGPDAGHPPPVITPPPVPVVEKWMAPQTINPEMGGNARFCPTGLPMRGDRYYEPSSPGVTYNSDGLCDGGRTERMIDGLRGTRSMDDATICGYTYQGRTFPPWPAESYLK